MEKVPWEILDNLAYIGAGLLMIAGCLIIILVIPDYFWIMSMVKGLLSYIASIIQDRLAVITIVVSVAAASYFLHHKGAAFKFRPAGRFGWPLILSMDLNIRIGPRPPAVASRRNTLAHVRHNCMVAPSTQPLQA